MSSEKDTLKIFNIKLEDLNQYPNIESFLESLENIEIVEIAGAEIEVASLVKKIEEIQELQKRGQIYAPGEDNEGIVIGINMLPEALKDKVIEWLGAKVEKVEVGKKEVQEKARVSIEKVEGKVVDIKDLEVKGDEGLNKNSKEIDKKAEKTSEGFKKAMEEYKKLFPDGQGGKTENKEKKKGGLSDALKVTEKEKGGAEEASYSEVEEESPIKEEKVEEDDFEIPKEVKDLKLKNYTPKQQKLMREIRVEDKTLWEFIKDTIEFSFDEKDKEQINLLEELRDHLYYHQINIVEGEKKLQVNFKSFVKEERENLEKLKNIYEDHEDNKEEQDEIEKKINLLKKDPRAYFDKEKDYIRQEMANDQMSFKEYKDAFEKLKKVAGGDTKELEKEIEQKTEEVGSEEEEDETGENDGEKIEEEINNIDNKKSFNRSQKQEIKKIKINISELKKKLENTDSEEERKLYQVLIEQLQEEIITVREKIVRKGFFKKVGDLTVNVFEGVKKMKNFKFPGEEQAAVINTQIYKSLSNIFAFKSITDWSGYVIAKVGESKLLRKTKLGEKMSKLGNRTDVYKYFEQKEESKADRKDINSKFTELLKIVNEKENIYNADSNYNEKFSDLTNKVEEKLEYIRENFTKSINQYEQDIVQIQQKLNSLEELLGEKAESTAEFINLKKKIKEKRKVLDDLLTKRKDYVNKEITPLSLERNELKEDKKKELESSEGFENLNISIAEQAKLYNEMIDSGRTPEFYDLPLDKRKEIEDKINEGALSPQEKSQYFLSTEDKASLKRRLGSILVENAKKKEKINEKINKDTDKVTKDYIRGKVRGATLVKDILNTAVISTLGPAGASLRGVIYGGASMVERYQEKKIEYRKKYKNQDIISQGKFLRKDTFFNSAIELYKGLSGKQLKVDYKRDAYGKLVVKKDSEQLEGKAKFIRIMKSVGELVRGGAIGGQAVGSIITEGANIEGIANSFQETINSSPNEIIGRLSSNLYQNAENVIRIDRKIGKMIEVKNRIFGTKVDDSSELVKSTADWGEKVNTPSNKGLFSNLKNTLKENFNKVFLGEDSKIDQELPGTDSTSVKTGVEPDSLRTEVPDSLDVKPDGIDFQEAVVDNTGTGEGAKEVVVTAAYEQLLSKKGGDDRIVEMLKDVTNKQDRQSILDKLGDSEKIKVAVVDDKEGISQALGIKDIQDEDTLTIINQDGTVVHGDLNLVHKGDTVFQSENGDLFCKTTSGVDMSGKGSLQEVYDNVAEHHGITEVDDSLKEVFNTDGKGEFASQMNSQEAENLDNFLDVKLDKGTTSIEDYLGILNKGEKSQLYDLLNEAKVKGESSPDGLGKVVQDFKDSLDLGDDDPIIDTSDTIIATSGEKDTGAENLVDKKPASKTELKTKEEVKPEVKDSTFIPKTDQKTEIFNILEKQKNGKILDSLAHTTDKTDPIILENSTHFKISDSEEVLVKRLDFVGEVSQGRLFKTFDSNEKALGEIIFKFPEDDGEISNMEIVDFHKASSSVLEDVTFSEAMTPELPENYLDNFDSELGRFKALNDFFEGYKQDNISQVKINDQLFRTDENGHIFCGDQEVTPNNIDEIIKREEVNVADLEVGQGQKTGIEKEYQNAENEIDEMWEKSKNEIDESWKESEVKSDGMWKGAWEEARQNVKDWETIANIDKAKVGDEIIFDQNIKIGDKDIDVSKLKFIGQEGENKVFEYYIGDSDQASGKLTMEPIFSADDSNDITGMRIIEPKEFLEDVNISSVKDEIVISGDKPSEVLGDTRQKTIIEEKTGIKTEFSEGEVSKTLGNLDYSIRIEQEFVPKELLKMGADNHQIKMDFAERDPQTLDNYVCPPNASEEVVNMIDDYNVSLDKLTGILSKRHSLTETFEAGGTNSRTALSTYQSIKDNVDVARLPLDENSEILFNNQESNLANYYNVLKKQNELLTEEIKDALKVKNIEDVFKNGEIKSKYQNNLDLINKYQANNQALEDVTEISKSFPEEEDLFKGEDSIISQRDRINTEADKYDTNNQIDHYIDANFKQQEDIGKVIDEVIESFESKSLKGKDFNYKSAVESKIKTLILNDKSIAYSYLKSAKAGDKSDVLQSIEKYLDKILEKFTPSKDFQLTRNNLQAVFNATKFEHNF